MLEGRLWKLTLDMDSDSFWAAALEESDTPSEQKKVRKRTLAGDVRFMDVQKASNEPKRAGSISIHFHPKGLVEPAVIHLAGPGKQVQTLCIKPFNGRLVVEDGYVEYEAYSVRISNFELRIADLGMQDSGYMMHGRQTTARNIEQQNKEPQNDEVVTSLFEISCSIFCGS
jgi:hypothetical protein